MFIIILINIVNVYYNLVLVLYIKGLILKAVIVIFIIFTTINKWLEVLLTSSIFIKMVLKVRLCSLYAARATNLLTRAEPMQRRILDWGREVVAVFQKGSENFTLGG